MQTRWWASLAPETAAEMEDAFALQISIIATNVLKRVAEARRWNGPPFASCHGGRQANSWLQRP